MKKNYFVSIAAALMLFFGVGNALAIPVVSVDMDPGTTGIQTTLTVAAGNSFAVNVVITDVTSLNAFELDLDFDPSVVTATAVGGGGFLSGFPLEANVAAPDVNFAELVLFGLPGTGNGILVSMLFDAGLSAGTSALHLNDVILSAPFGFSITPFTLEDGSVTVAAAVPEPGIFVLMGAGLLMLALLRRRPSKLEKFISA